MPSPASVIDLPLNKTCSLCKEDKSYSAFGNDPRVRCGKVAICNDCARMKNKKWRENNKEKHRQSRKKSQIKQRYGISQEMFYLILAAQNNRCGICKTLFDSKKRPSIDHCHETGRVRGILCQKCNTGIGMFLEKEYILSAAAEYLFRYGSLK